MKSMAASTYILPSPGPILSDKVHRKISSLERTASLKHQKNARHSTSKAVSSHNDDYKVFTTNGRVWSDVFCIPGESIGPLLGKQTNISIVCMVTRNNITIACWSEVTKLNSNV